MQGRAMLTVVATAALAALLAASASAAVSKGGGFRYVSKRFAVDAQTTKTYKVPCPDGTHVYSGGYYNAGDYNSGFVLHSFPYDDGDRRRKPDDGWKARLFTANSDVTWLAYAVCARPMPVYQHKRITLETGLTYTVSDTCQAERYSFSGGTRGDDFVVEVLSHPNLVPNAHGWIVKLDRMAAEVSDQLDLYVVCSDLQVAYFNGPDTAQPNTQAGDSTACPATAYKHVVGGGISHDGARADIGLAASRPDGFPGPTTDSWQGFVDNYDLDDTNNAVTFNVWVACAQSLN